MAQKWRPPHQRVPKPGLSAEQVLLLALAHLLDGWGYGRRSVAAALFVVGHESPAGAELAAKLLEDAAGVFPGGLDKWASRPWVTKDVLREVFDEALELARAIRRSR